MHFVLGALTVVTLKQRNPSAPRNGMRDLNFSNTSGGFFSLYTPPLTPAFPHLSTQFLYLSQMAPCFAFAVDQPGILADCTR